MDHHVHLAALRAAAKVALATTVLLGCSATADDESEATSSNLEDKNEDAETACTDQDAGSSPTADASLPPALDAGAPLPCCWMVDLFNDGTRDPNVACTSFGPGCTPWGPPVPPAMSRGVRGIA